MEQNILEYLGRAGYTFRDNTDATDKPDFFVRIAGEWVALEVKEKRQPIATSRWPTPQGVAESDLFILDELTVRKLMLHGVHSVVAVWVGDAYYLYTLADLMVMPKVRCNREMAPGVIKGKWIIQLSHAAKRCADAAEVLRVVERYVEKSHDVFLMSPCYHERMGDVQMGGTHRTEAQHQHDYNVTRPHGQGANV